jgi:hypothetical protein
MTAALYFQHQVNCKKEEEKKEEEKKEEAK